MATGLSNVWSGAILPTFAMILSFPLCALAVASESLSDGTQFIHKLAEQAAGWNDYTCITEMHNFKPDKTTISSSRFYYRKGPEIRIEVMGGGFRDGSVILKKKDGSIKGRGGTWMGGIQMNLDPDSRMLILPSGINASKADFPELFVGIKEDIGRGFTCKVSPAPISEPTIPAEKVFVMEVADKDQQLAKRIFLGGEDKVPVRWDSYKGGKLVTQTWFKNVKINGGISDDKFQI